MSLRRKILGSFQRRGGTDIVMFICCVILILMMTIEFASRAP